MHKITLMVHILNDGSHSHHMTMTRHCESAIVPSLGMTLEEPAFKKSRVTPIDVTVSLEHNVVYVQLENVGKPSRESCEAEVEMFRGHGWKTVAEDR